MITGSCLCQGVRFEIAGDAAASATPGGHLDATGPVGLVSQCHCQDCRKAQGSAFAVNAPVSRSDFRFTSGEDLLASYESSPGKHRVFCSRCGSPVYSRLDEAPEVLRIRLGLVDGDPGVRPAVHGWVSDKAPWERLPDDGQLRFATGSPDSLLPRLKIRVEAPSSPDAHELLAALDADLARDYPPEVIFGLHDEDHDIDRMVFLVARIRDEAVACGALRSLDAVTGEVKRMYVCPALRGTGISRRLLAVIETIAMGRGHRVMKLETGNLSPEALALYRSSGYREVPAWGEYAGNDYSICFEKAL